MSRARLDGSRELTELPSKSVNQSNPSEPVARNRGPITGAVDAAVVPVPLPPVTGAVVVPVPPPVVTGVVVSPVVAGAAAASLLAAAAGASTTVAVLTTGSIVVTFLPDPAGGGVWSVCPGGGVVLLDTSYSVTGRVEGAVGGGTTGDEVQAPSAIVRTKAPIASSDRLIR